MVLRTSLRVASNFGERQTRQQNLCAHARLEGHVPVTWRVLRVLSDACISPALSFLPKLKNKKKKKKERKEKNNRILRDCDCQICCQA